MHNVTYFGEKSDFGGQTLFIDDGFKNRTYKNNDKFLLHVMTIKFEVFLGRLI